jgi:hypothetical protein
MNQSEIDELRAAVDRVHRCPATYRTSEWVREQGRQVEVAVFDILGHPRALICYAWYGDADSKGRRRIHTVLREGPVHSSIDAVRFSLEDEA